MREASPSGIGTRDHVDFSTFCNRGILTPSNSLLAISNESRLPEEIHLLQLLQGLILDRAGTPLQGTPSR
jgi:hypothetical protein